MAAAVAVAARNSSSRSKRFSGHTDDRENVLAKFTAHDNGDCVIVRDINLMVLLNGAWKKRRIVCTKENLFFALLEDDLIRDRIPFQDIISVEVMSEPKELEPYISKFREPAISNSHDNNKPDESDNHSAVVRVLQIRTLPEGFNSGRAYYLQAETKEECESFVDHLRLSISTVQMQLGGGSFWLRTQNLARLVFESTQFQIMSSFLILLNFAASIAQVELPAASSSPRSTAIMDALEVGVTLAFTLELAIHLVATGPRQFFRSSWSMLDMAVVVVSLVSLAPVGLPGRLVLLMRCARGLRIFGKLAAVYKIFAALRHSIVPMANAFFVIFVVSAIYAVVGATLLADDSPDDFAGFWRALATMFRITAGGGDWWFDHFPPVHAGGGVNLGPSLFFVSYVVLSQWVFLQVSIAVLLDNFLTASSAMKQEEEIREIQKRQMTKQFVNPLDPLLLRLGKDYTDGVDLDARLAELFKLLDADGSGDLSSQEFQEAVKKLDFSPRIFVSDSDFLAMTHDGALCNARGRLGPAEFASVMRAQLRVYTQGRLSATSEWWRATDAEFTELGALKQVLLEQLAMRADHEATRTCLGAIAERLGLRPDAASATLSPRSPPPDAGPWPLHLRPDAPDGSRRSSVATADAFPPAALASPRAASGASGRRRPSASRASMTPSPPRWPGAGPGSIRIASASDVRLPRFLPPRGGGGGGGAAPQSGRSLFSRSVRRPSREACDTPKSSASADRPAAAPPPPDGRAKVSASARGLPLSPRSWWWGARTRPGGLLLDAPALPPPPDGRAGTPAAAQGNSARASSSRGSLRSVGGSGGARKHSTTSPHPAPAHPAAASGLVCPAAAAVLTGGGGEDRVQSVSPAAATSLSPATPTAITGPAARAGPRAVSASFGGAAAAAAAVDGGPTGGGLGGRVLGRRGSRTLRAPPAAGSPHFLAAANGGAAVRHGGTAAVAAAPPPLLVAQVIRSRLGGGASARRLGPPLAAASAGDLDAAAATDGGEGGGGGSLPGDGAAGGAGAPEVEAEPCAAAAEVAATAAVMGDWEPGGPGAVRAI